jgi:squalene synthase HpnC
MKTGVDHAENFPVASWLCPPHLRPVIAAIYWFARTADDLADEGDASPETRLADLSVYRTQLDLAASGSAHQTPLTAFAPRWQAVFEPLAQHIQDHALPVHLLHDLLSAFEQDVHRTASGQRYANELELLDYCRLSANPVGRLLLHLYGVTDPVRLAESDCICSALQLINFWQDLSVDIPRHRHYLPQAELRARGLSDADFSAATSQQATDIRKSKLVAALLMNACDTMQKGSKLPLHVPGRAGWELRLVVQGGLRLAEKIRHMQHRTWASRPTLGLADAPVLLWRAWRMG